MYATEIAFRAFQWLFRGAKKGGLGYAAEFHWHLWMPSQVVCHAVYDKQEKKAINSLSKQHENEILKGVPNEI